MTLPQFPIVMKTVQLRLIEPRDARFVLDLRLDPRLNRFLSRVDNDLDQQVEWVRRYKVRQDEGDEYYFIVESIEASAVRLGTVRLYDFQDESFSWGSWILKPDAPRFAAVEVALAVYDFGFDVLGFSMSHFDVRQDNLRVIRFHERFGAVRVKEDNVNIYFQLSQDQYKDVRPRYARLLG